MSEYVIEGVTLRAMTCGTCGVKHAMPAIIYDTAREEGGFWHCPNGHRRGWTEAQGALAEREAAQRRRLESALQGNARLAEEAAEANRLCIKAEKKLASQKRRIAAGVCPCCNRTFAKLAMHMTSKHPDYNVVPLKVAK